MIGPSRPGGSLHATVRGSAMACYAQPMTLEFFYTMLLIVMLGASGVFALYVIYRLLRG
jgi:hypothetical protein